MREATSANAYSDAWFERFAASVPVKQTEQEVAFLTRTLPVSTFLRIADLCCGEGRHASALGALGYNVTGIDRSARAIDRARALASGRARFECADTEHAVPLAPPVDACLCLWQSFGYWSDDRNRAWIERVADSLRPGGRFVLDVYHPGFFLEHQGTRTTEREGVRVTESKRVEAGRLRVELTHAGTTDVFDWFLYSPDDVREMAHDAGLRVAIACANFDESIAPTPEIPRAQYVLEREVPRR